MIFEITMQLKEHLLKTKNQKVQMNYMQNKRYMTKILEND